jgi:hypothetical protein
MKHVRIPDFSQPAPRRRIPAPAFTVRPALRLELQCRDTVAALHDERLPGEIEPWEAVAPVRPDTAHSRSLRFLDVAGELLAAVAIIGGGIVLTGLASLL